MIRIIFGAARSSLRTKRELALENLALRHQIRNAHPCSRRSAPSFREMGSRSVGGPGPSLGGVAIRPGVAKYMVRERRFPSPSWRAFLENHVKDLVAIDFFTVPTATFGVLFGFLVLAHDRRRVLHFNVTANPTAEWTARQVVQAFPRRRRRGISCAIVTGSTAAGFVACWRSCASRRWSRRRGHRGRTHTWSGSSARSDGSAWITSSSLARSISCGSWLGTSSTTIGRAAIFHCWAMRRIPGRRKDPNSAGWLSCLRSAGCIIVTSALQRDAMVLEKGRGDGSLLVYSHAEVPDRGCRMSTPLLGRRQLHLLSGCDRADGVFGKHRRRRAFADTSVSCPTNPISALLTVKSKLALLH